MLGEEGFSLSVFDARYGMVASWWLDDGHLGTTAAISDDGGAVCVATASGRVLVYRERDAS